MSVYKRARSPYYQYDFQIDGQQFRGSTEATSERKAREVEKEIKKQKRAELDQLKAIGDAPALIDVAFDRYWTEWGQYRANADDLFRDLGRIQDWLKSQGIQLLTEINDNVIARLVAWRRTHYRWDDPEKGLISPAHVNRSTTEVIRRVMVRARDLWKLPLPNMPKWGDHKLKEPEERVRVLKPHENAALAAVADPDYEELRKFSLASGLRQNENLLRWKNVDLVSGQITTIGKGGKKVHLPITSTMETILRGRMGHHREFVFTFVAKRHTDRYRKGTRQPITAAGLKSYFRRRKKKAGVEDYRWHDNRHTFATELLRETGNLKLVQRGLNHSRIETTSKYAHVLDDELRVAMEAASQKRDAKFEQGVPTQTPHTEGKKGAKRLKSLG